MLDKPFKDANIVIQTIESHGYSAYYVGGCIRDYLLNKKINDFKILVITRLLGSFWVHLHCHFH